MDSVTVQECIDLYERQGIRIIINNGHVIGFEKEEEL